MVTRVRFNRAFKASHETRARYVLLKGGAGSGKSTDTAMLYILRLISEPGRNLLAMRKSGVSNRDSTFAELEAAAERMGLTGYFAFKRNPPEIACINGNRVIFRGMNDVRQREKIKSITFAAGALTDIWLEEASEFTAEDVEILDDRLRGSLPDGMFYQMRLTFNPVSAGRWIKERFFDRPSAEVFLHSSTYRDNAFLDSGFKARMERRRVFDPEGYGVYGEGEWGDTGGLILTDWAAEELCGADFERLFIGQDFGYNHLNAMVLIGERDGDIYVLREFCVRGMTTEGIIAACGFPKDVPMYCDSAEPDRIEAFRRAGFLAMPVKKEAGSVCAQIEFLKGRRIHIDASCTQVLREISEWRWLKDSGGGYLDVPAPGGDDAMAALRYAVEGLRRGQPKVKTVRGLKI